MSVWLCNAFALLIVAVLVSCSDGGIVVTLAIEGSIAVSPSNKVEIADNATSNNNSPASAQPIAPGDSIAGSAGVGDAGTDFTAPFAFRIHDFYRVTVNEPATIVLTIANDDTQLTAIGNVGTGIVELIDAATGVTVASTTAAAADGYRFGFPASGIPAGCYRMRAGTDRDGDGEICEIEDACGEFPDEIVYTGSTLSNRNYSVGHFRLAEPGPISGPVSVQSR